MASCIKSSLIIALPQDLFLMYLSKYGHAINYTVRVGPYWNLQSPDKFVSKEIILISPLWIMQVYVNT